MLFIDTEGDTMLQDIQLHLKGIVEVLPFSMGASAVTYIFTTSFGIHLEMFLIFAVIVCLDILTRWLACSHKLWESLYPQTPSTLYDCFRLLWQSRELRFFDSNRMRSGFKSKMITYLILVIASGFSDAIINVYGGRGYMLTLVVYILTATEFISCLENLEEAGVGSVASDLKKIIKGRKDKIT